MAGGHGRRGQAAAAAGAVAPTRMWSSLGNKRVWKLQRVLGEVGVARVGSDDGRRVELCVGVHGAGGGSAVARARGGVLHFIGADTCEGSSLSPTWRPSRSMA
jgi:hypothetical protein